MKYANIVVRFNVISMKNSIINVRNTQIDFGIITLEAV